MDRRLLGFGVAMAAAVALIVGTVVFGLVGVEGVVGDAETVWEAEAATGYAGDHYTVGVAEVDGASVLAVPSTDGEGCGVSAFDSDGERRWRDRIADADCSPHGVGGIGTATVDGEATFLVPTRPGRLIAYDADTGDRRFVYELDGAGFTAPVAADVTGDGTPEAVVVDAAGTLHVVDAAGEAVWTRELEGTVAREPLADDVDGDGAVEVAVAVRSGGSAEIALFGPDGERRWTADAGSGVTSWTTAAPDEGAGGDGVVVAGVGSGRVIAFDAGDGSDRWEAKLQDTRVDVGDTTPGRVLVGGSNTVWSLGLRDGDVVWRQRIGDAGQLTGPTVTDIDGDGEYEAIAVGTGGIAAVLIGETGTVDGRYDAAGTVYVPAGTADLTGDGRTELLLLVDDGRVVAVSIGE